MPHRDPPNYGSVNAVDDDDDDAIGAVVEPSSLLLKSKDKKASSILLLLLAFSAAVAAMMVVSLRYARDGIPALRQRHRDGTLMGGTTTALLSFSSATSSSSPEHDLGLVGIDRAPDALPSDIWKYYIQKQQQKNKQGGYSKSDTTTTTTTMVPLPTNSWYQNLVSQGASDQPSGTMTKAYTVPYVVDMAPLNGMMGLRLHWPVMQASDRNMQMVYDAQHGLSLGTKRSLNNNNKKRSNNSNPYVVDPNEPLSLLGVSFQWMSGDNNNSEDDHGPIMETSLVRGMPTATMRYMHGTLPTIASAIRLASPGLVDGDGDTMLHCNDSSMTSQSSGSTTTRVESEVLLHFKGSDFSWVVFFSKPVQLECLEAAEAEFGTTPGGGAAGSSEVQLELNVVEYDYGDDEPLIVQVALVNQCTTGESDIKKHCLPKNRMKNEEGYIDLLRKHRHAYPKAPKVDFDYHHKDKALITFDWDAQSSARRGHSTKNSGDQDELLMFALPHHQLQFKNKHGTKAPTRDDFCVHTFHGMTCIAQGDTWTIQEDLERSQSFVAARPPAAWAIADLATALSKDIHYQLSDNLMRGAADTYFSGKLMARLGRVIEISTELKDLASSSANIMTPVYYDDVDVEEYAHSVEAARNVALPTDKEIFSAVEQLKKGVQIWVNGKGEAPYVYDRSWGGMVNCGCHYKGKGDKGSCVNSFPNCPALSDVNVDFGNGYYNDHHFHYGYHIYAAAVAAKHDPEWGRSHFDKIMLYVRDIATPSPNDEFFTQFRQKDWFLGSSWASGIVSGENSPHGRNEESSSEAIAAYEAMALYGAVMVDAFRDDPKSETQYNAAKDVRNVGELLTVSEVHAANRYWHVWDSPTHNNTYPKEYKQPVVGMLYQTMASFQTWFGPDPFFSYGIQLLPLTAVGEIRDDPTWATALYGLYDKSCRNEHKKCVDNGWSIIQYGLLATTGHRKEALEQVMSIPDGVFASDGGLGNSMSNSIWYIATRKPVATVLNNSEL